MARIARVVAPGMPHHITHRGNRRQATCFCAADSQADIARMGTGCRSCAGEIWAYGLLPNPVHLIAVPGRKTASGEPSGKPTGGGPGG